MNGKQARIRTMMLVLGIILSTLSLSQQVSGAQSQSGPDVGDKVLGQVDMCEALGGTATVTFDSVGTMVICNGGLLDGLICDNTAAKTTCGFHFFRPGEEISVPPTGGIEVVPEEPLETLVITESASVVPVVAENPTLGKAVVIANQSGSTVNDNALNQINWCRALGGVETVDTARTVGGGLELTIVQCKGGVLDGLWCVNDAQGTLCSLPTPVPPDEEPNVTPAGGIEDVAESPTATVVATEEPTAPASTPTEVAVEPTEETEDPRVVPTIATDDNTVPPGPIEDPGPTPTEAPILL